MRMPAVVAALLIVAINPQRADAGDCQAKTLADCPDPSAPIFTCFNQLLNPEIEAETTRAAEEMQSGIESEIPDEVLEAVSAATGGDAGALVDLLPTFLGALGFDGMEDDDGNFQFERPVVLGANSPLRLTLGGKLIVDPELFSPLKEALEEDLTAEVADEREASLEEDLKELDSLDLQLRLALEREAFGRRWGRDYGDYTSLFQGMFGEIGKRVDSTARLRELQDLVNAIDPQLAAATVAEVKAQPEPKRHQIIDAFNRALNEQCTVAAAMNELEAQGFDQLGDLIANQPQLLLTGVYRERDELTGPDEWSIKLRYEIGAAGNINDFVTWARNHQSDGCAVQGQEPNYSCLVSYLKARPKTAESGHRLSLDFEVSEADPFDFALPDDDFAFHLDRTEKLIGALSYGRELGSFRLANGGEEESARLGFEAKYQDVTGDPMRQSRFEATATLSQKTTACTVLSLSAVWANRPEYRGEVDQELSARLGLRWDKKPLEGCKGVK